jgi:hypothetical protein
VERRRVRATPRRRRRADALSRYLLLQSYRSLAIFNAGGIGGGSGIPRPDPCDPSPAPRLGIGTDDMCTTNPYAIDSDPVRKIHRISRVPRTGGSGEDGLSDGIEEARKSLPEDFPFLFITPRCDGINQNHNGRIDGDNGDGKYETSETWYETSPSLTDSDGDTFLDNWEKQKSYNPLSRDTDEDNIPDNEEDLNGNGFRDGTETSAKSKDTDSDGLNDYMEKMGWTIVTYREATMEKISEYTVTSDPNDPDHDQDGLKDLYEFQNQTDPNDNDTDNDGFEDKDEIEAGTLPIGLEGIPPMITYYNNEYALRLNGLKLPDVILKIYVNFEDNYYMDYVEVKVKGLQMKNAYTGLVKQSSHYFEWTLSYDQAQSALFNSFEVNLSAKDKNGNEGYYLIQTKSISEAIVISIVKATEAVYEKGKEFFEPILKRLYTTMISNIFEKLFYSLDKLNGIYINAGNVLLGNGEEQVWTYSYVIEWY